MHAVAKHKPYAPHLEPNTINQCCLCAAKLEVRSPVSAYRQVREYKSGTAVCCAAPDCGGAAALMAGSAAAVSAHEHC